MSYFVLRSLNESFSRLISLFEEGRAVFFLLSITRNFVVSVRVSFYLGKAASFYCGTPWVCHIPSQHLTLCDTNILNCFLHKVVNLTQDERLNTNDLYRYYNHFENILLNRYEIIMDAQARKVILLLLESMT